MDSAFAWLGYLVEWIGAFIPRLRIVRCTHAGVRFKHGKFASAIKPGLCIYWPIVTEVDIIPVARQTHNMPSQSLTTKDGKKVVVGGVVVYSVKDIVACMSKNWDVYDTINDITLCAIMHVITKHDYAFILEHITDEIQVELTKETRRRLKSYGIQVIRTALTDFSTAVVIKNIGGGRLLTHNAE